MSCLMLSRHGVWYFRKTYLLPSGKRKEIRRSLRTRCKREANQLVKRMLEISPCTQDKETKVSPFAPIVPQSLALVASSGPSYETGLSDAISLFIKEKEISGAWKQTEVRRVGNMLNFLLEVLGDVPVSSIGKAEANNYKAKLMESDRSVTTMNNYLTRASMLFSWLEKREDCTNPFKGTAIKQKPVRASSHRDAYTPTDKQKYLLFAQSVEEWRKWILLLLRYTGARPAEICQLYRDDVDCENLTITITDKRPDQSLKTLNSERVIPIHKKLVELGFITFVQSGEHERVFPQLNRIKETYSFNFISWYGKRKAAGADVPGLYGARHTAATEMKSAGVPEQYASAILGHGGHSITYDRYGKAVAPEYLIHAISTIGS